MSWAWAGEGTGAAVGARHRLGCRRPAPPSEPTFRRVLQRVDAVTLDQRMLSPKWPPGRSACPPPSSLRPTSYCPGHSL